jgi:1-pyrroline-5-carboxylate dehydrogenase
VQVLERGKQHGCLAVAGSVLARDGVLGGLFVRGDGVGRVSPSADLGDAEQAPAAAAEAAGRCPGIRGSYDDSTGFFVRPTLLVSDDPADEVFTTEYFGPILALHIFEDTDFERVTDQLESASAYGLTGAVIARDRAAIAYAAERLRFAAGNFYINDKPTGAVVGQQPFGGSRASGTNDKAGSPLNLQRWTSPRAIKETFNAETNNR